MPKNSYAAIDCRRDDLLRYLASHQKSSLTEIKEQTGTSEITVRRDLNALSLEGLISKNSQGLYSLNCDPAFDPRYFLRYSAQHAKKAAIARSAVQLIHPGSFLFLGSGTTVLELSKHLTQVQPLSIATNNLYIPMYISQQPGGIQVKFLGGDVDYPSMSTFSPYTCQRVAQHHADIVFFSEDGLDFETGISTDEYALIDVKRAMLAHSEKKVLLLDSSKMNKRALQYVMPLAEVDTVIIDAAASEADLARLRQIVPSVIVAELERV